MKVEQKKSFTPIVITLESQEELDVLLIVLGESHHKFFTEHCKKGCAKTLNQVAYKMYDVLANWEEDNE